VLRNLLANALRYTPNGGIVTLHVTPGTSLPDTECRDGGVQSAELIMVAVEDTGPGIAAVDLPHVFERFWRADSSRSRMQGGSGLGLAISRQLVQAQGGQIGVTSRVGRGSRFWFTVPIATEAQILANTVAGADAAPFCC
jgi:signal transduction histidine kinase